MNCKELYSTRSRSFDFSNLQRDETIVLEPAVCVEEVRELVVVVQVHAVAIAAPCTLRVVAVAAAPTPEQPEVWYPGLVELATLSIDGTSAGTLLRGVVAGPLPSHVQLRLLAVGSAPTPMSATLSVMLEGTR